MSTHSGMVLHAQWNELKHLRKMVLKKEAPESIHDLRVASRRIRAALRLFAPFVGRKRLEFVGKRIRRLTRRLGRLRNIDEAINFFSVTTREPHELMDQLKALRKRELILVMKTLKNFPHNEMDWMIKKIVAELRIIPSKIGKPPDWPAYFSQTSVTGFQEIHNLLAPAAAFENIKAHHALRIAIKKWRYCLETIALIIDKDYNSILGPLKEYQTLLGKMNDMTEFAALCDSLELTPDCRRRISFRLNDAREQFFNSFNRLLETRPLQYTFIL